MIFSAVKTGGFGARDLYISFKNADNSWTTPQNFGNTINTTANEYYPDITADGKYMTYGNGNDIYWVAIENTIADLRATSGVTSIAKSENQDIKIYPNPSNGKFNISFGETLNHKVSIQVTDITGRLILSETYNNISNTTIDLNTVTKGIYFVNLNINGKITNQKICVE